MQFAALGETKHQQAMQSFLGIQEPVVGIQKKNEKINDVE
jgi:hypothetical protein